MGSIIPYTILNSQDFFIAHVINSQTSPDHCSSRRRTAAGSSTHERHHASLETETHQVFSFYGWVKTRPTKIVESWNQWVPGHFPLSYSKKKYVPVSMATTGEKKLGGLFPRQKLGSLYFTKTSSDHFYGFSGGQRAKQPKPFMTSNQYPQNFLAVRSSLGTSANKRASPHTDVTSNASNGKHVTTWQTPRHWECICTRKRRRLKIWKMLSNQPNTKRGSKLKTSLNAERAHMPKMQSAHIIIIDLYISFNLLPIYSDDLQIVETNFISSKRTYVVYVGLVPFMMS